MFRIGIGSDIHKLVEGRSLILGGVVVPFERGAEGHSDADTLLHAIADAILGALAAGDLGSHFPDTAPEWKNANSMKLLSRVMELAGERGFHVVNVDSNVMLERPKLQPHIAAMRGNIAEALKVDASCVSVKARTGEGQDAVGQGNAVSAQAVVLLESVSS